MLLNKNKPKVPDHFYYGDRKLNNILARMRMSCSELKNDLYRIKVVDSPLCSCAQAKETPVHYFLTCNKYVVFRAALHDEILLLKSHFNIKTLLNGDNNVNPTKNKQILDAVFKYILITC